MLNKLSTRKNTRKCPVCTKNLHKIGKGTRYENRCSNCNAVLAKELICTYCNTNRVWRGPEGIYCHGCGKQYISK